MICKRKNIDREIFIRMSTLYDLERVINQFTFAIDFKLVFNNFTDLADFSFKWVCACQRAEYP